MAIEKYKKGKDRNYINSYRKEGKKDVRSNKK